MIVGMGVTNIIDDIKTDHQELESYYNKYKSATTVEEGNKWFHQFVWEICRHSVAEELVLYPLLESLSQRGKDLADEGRKDHHMVKEMLTSLEKLHPATAEFDHTFDSMMTDIRKHVEQEETEDLVLLSDNVTPENLQRAGKAFAMKKKIAPTHPHTSIPEKPVALEAALGLLTAPIDKFRDLFNSFPDEKEL